jgi:hypothetical protein
MNKKVKVIDADQAVVNSGIKRSPVTELARAAGDFLIMSEVAQRYGVHVETIRRITRLTDEDGQKKLKAPSKALQQGKMVVYLFTEEDVKEMDAYMNERGYEVIDV